MTHTGDTAIEAAGGLRELAYIGAAAAASALAQLLGRTVSTRSPRPRAGAPAPLPDRGAGIVFEAHGDRTGLVAIVLPEDALGAVAEVLLGTDSVHRNIDVLRSALCELGNIVASHTLSSIAEVLGEQILPSLPLLVMESDEPSLPSRIDRRQRSAAGVRFESELELDGGARALLIWIPDPRK